MANVHMVDGEGEIGRYVLSRHFDVSDDFDGINTRIGNDYSPDTLHKMSMVCV